MLPGAAPRQSKEAHRYINQHEQLPQARPTVQRHDMEACFVSDDLCARAQARRGQEGFEILRRQRLCGMQAEEGGGAEGSDR